MGMNEERELKIYELMDEYGIDQDAAEQLLLDEEESSLFMD